MNIIDTKFKGLLICIPDIFTDHRGWFMESFNQHVFNEELQKRGFEAPVFVQDNHSLSHKGVLRGLHYQIPPHAQGKLVRVIQGKVWDVVVDIRPDSDTFGQWFGIELSADNHKQLWIPPGFAHGFLSLENHTQLLYKTTAHYHPEHEKVIFWNDPILKIHWPLETINSILQTQKDQSATTFNQLMDTGHYNKK
ncbi:dTDP-4-dehydrorhamnose 3,5-epimerase [Neisseriaceae bacterium ESL0693]|nr:dTDP-4-dehydrorhamnose 3,5-epimerase [Neisseriaceae bacterium ESL0693]